MSTKQPGCFFLATLVAFLSDLFQFQPTEVGAREMSGGSTSEADELKRERKGRVEWNTLLSSPLLRAPL